MPTLSSIFCTLKYHPSTITPRQPFHMINNPLNYSMCSNFIQKPQIWWEINIQKFNISLLECWGFQKYFTLFSYLPQFIYQTAIFFFSWNICKWSNCWWNINPLVSGHIIKYELYFHTFCWCLQKKKLKYRELCMNLGTWWER